MTVDAAVNTPPAATLVPDERRMDFLPALFGLSLLIVGEHTVYHFLDRLSPDYGGGFWVSRAGRRAALPPARVGRPLPHKAALDLRGKLWTRLLR